MTEKATEPPEELIHRLHRYVVVWERGRENPVVCRTGWDLESVEPSVLLRDIRSLEVQVVITPILAESEDEAYLKGLCGTRPKVLGE